MAAQSVLFANHRHWTTKIAYIFITLIFLNYIISSNILAFSSTTAVAITVRLDEEVVDGDIIILDNEGYKKSADASNGNIVGVVNFNPPVLISELGEDLSLVPVITSGVTNVRVSNLNGEIKKGDLITSSSSSQRGIGAKAVSEGYVIGKSLEDFNQDTVGIIAVLVSIFYNNNLNNNNQGNSSSLWGLIEVSSDEVIREPSRALRYLIATTILIASFAFGITTFGSVAKNGINAIGRNPMASGKIQLSIFLNSLIAIAIIGGGIAAAIVIAIT